MKPITHPLAIALLDAIEASTTNGRLSDKAFRARVEWARSGFLRYADPTPLPAPALGMRVWTVGGGDGETWLREPVTINYVRPGATWSDYVKFVDEIALITNYCKGDIVLWERQ